MHVNPLPADLNSITEARSAAEESGDDQALLALRELELAHLALPPVIDGVRRSRLLHFDAISTTWEGGVSREANASSSAASDHAGAPTR